MVWAEYKYDLDIDHQALKKDLDEEFVGGLLEYPELGEEVCD